MSKNVYLQIDKESLKNLNKQFAKMDTTIKKASEKLIFKILTKIQTFAKLRLKDRGHIVTGRLWNSIFVKHNMFKNTPTNPSRYSDNEGKQYPSDLRTVKLKDGLSGAVGTNVEYATKIEFMDSYLYWAMKNFDINKSIKEMEKDIRK